MKKKMVFVVLLFVVFVLQEQAVFAQNDYDRQFQAALNSNNIRNIERLLERRARQMNLEYCMVFTLDSETFSSTRGFNKTNTLDVLRLLVRHGADVKRQYISSFGGWGYPLQIATGGRQSLAVIQFLLDSGADPNRINSGTLFPLARAYMNNDMAAVNLLLERGADGSALLSELAAKGDHEFITRLINRGVSIRSDNGAQALRNAAENGHLQTVRVLVENGVNVNARNNEGVTALSIAYDKGEMEIHNYLLANGAVAFEPRQASQQPSQTAAQSQPTTITVQPSAPAQSPSAPSTITLQAGRYAASGTNHTVTLIRISDTSGTVNYYVGGGLAVGNGTYRINNNQLSLSFGPLSTNEGLKNKTFAYNIISSTSFAGNGENWVRTGL